MSIRPDWREEIRAMEFEIASGADPDPDRVRRLLAEAVEMAGECTVAEIQEVQAILDQLGLVASARKDAIQEEMVSLTRTREGLRGYGGIEETHRGQRLFRKV